MNKILLSIIAFLSVFSIVYPAEPPKEPILHINSAMHTATLWRISSDAKGKYILTCAEDKTAVLWDAKTCERITIFRPPIDSQDDGKLYACSLSPDGEIAAVGGWTAYNWTSANSVYIFDTKKNEIIAVIKNIPNIIIDLEFSPDGKYLAVCNAGESIKIFSTDTWKEKYDLAGYGERSNNACFDKNGRFASVCLDGKVRLYSRDFKLIAEATPNPGYGPFCIAFSPDGKKLAIGYDRFSKLQILNTTDLSVISEPDVTDTSEKFNLNVVAWSPDGKYLYASGGHSIYTDNDWWNVIRKFTIDGKGGYIEIPVALNRIMDMKTLPDGSVLYAGAFPDFGKMQSDNKIVFYKKGEINDFRNNDLSHYKLSTDGLSVGFTPSGQSPLTFSIKDRALSVKSSDEPEYRDTRAGFSVTDWKNSYSPKLNGKSLDFMNKLERSQCVDIGPGGNAIFIGSDWNLYCIDNTGKVNWETSIPGTAWAIKTNGNGKVVCVAYGDGTIRWYRGSDGRELLALFVNADLTRWVLWTPGGYYDASAGGQEMIGWHLNNGPEKAADFYPASRFEQQFYRPDIAALILETLDEPDAVAQADDASGRTSSKVLLTEILPPVVKIVEPSPGSSFDKPGVSLDLLIKTQADNPVEEIKLLLNGRPSGSSARGLSIVDKKSEGVRKTISVDLIEGENQVSVLAKNKNGYSEAVTITLYYKKQETGKKSEEFVIKPKLYVLAAGVSQYKDPDIRLQFAAKDAKDFAALIKKQKTGLYREIIVKTLTDAGATRDAILDGLDWLQKETTAHDIAMLFISGHGMNDNNGRLYYLPYEADIENLKKTSLPAQEICNTIQGINGKVIYFMDSCHSGNISFGRKGNDLDMNAVVNQLSSAENGAVIYSSSSGKQYSLENAEWNNGAFTKALLEGISGKADYTNDGMVTIHELALFIAEKVKTLTKGAQTPIMGKPEMMRDFPLLLN